MYVSKLRQKNAVNSMIDKIADDFDSCSDKIKRIKKICQKHFTKLQKMKNTQSEIKPIKIGKRPGTTYSLGVMILHIILGCKK